MLNQLPRQTTNNLMLMDANGDRAVAEITTESVIIRRAADTAALISTNHQRGQDQDTPGKCWRYDRIHAESQAGFGHLDVAAMEHMLRDVEQQDFTLQSMVFEPSNRVIYLAVGNNAPQHAFTRIDLLPYFNVIGSGPAH